MNKPINARCAAHMMEMAIKTLKQRSAIYGDAGECYEGVAKLRSAFNARESTPRDVVMDNVLERLDRLNRIDPANEKFKDTIRDAISDLAIAWEVS